MTKIMKRNEHGRITDRKNMHRKNFNGVRMNSRDTSREEEEQWDKLLKQALIPTEEPDVRLNQMILNRAEEKNVQEQNGERQGRKRHFSAAVVAAAILCMCSITAYGAWRYLTPGELAEHMGDEALADAFLSEGALWINEVQSYGGYDVTLLGIVSGEGLSKFQYFGDGRLLTDRSYVAVAIARSDGTPMPDQSEDVYGELEFFVSPLIGGYSPAAYNAAAMHGGYGEAVVNNVLYRLVECDNVELFADHDLYLCVSDSTFYSAEAYRYDKDTGKISRNAEYAGLNALFDLPMDASRANPQKAAEYMASLGVMELGFSEKKLHPDTDIVIGELLEQGTGAEVADYALQFVGNPYQWGGNSLTEGTDSSGFTGSVYEQFGVSLPHSAAEQRQQGCEVDGLVNAQSGDLLFYEEPSHVAIYLGDGWIVHAFPGDGICVSKADFDEIAEIRRVIVAE